VDLLLFQEVREKPSYHPSGHLLIDQLEETLQCRLFHEAPQKRTVLPQPVRKASEILGRQIKEGPRTERGRIDAIEDLFEILGLVPKPRGQILDKGYGLAGRGGFDHNGEGIPASEGPKFFVEPDKGMLGGDEVELTRLKTETLYGHEDAGRAEQQRCAQNKIWPG
jgi:hypothetical protein